MPEPLQMNDASLKHALVIGGGKGIGLAFVSHLLRNPKIAQVFVTYRSPSPSLVDLAAIHGDRLVPLAMDIAEEAQVSQVAEQLSQLVSSLHWVINCAGFLHEATIQPEKSLRQINADALLRYFQVNSVGAVLLAKHLQPFLKHRDRSIFAHLSAKVGSIGDNRLGGWYGYRASKAALNMFIRTIAIEYRRTCPHAIVVALHPGTTDTPLSKPFQRNVPPEKLFSPERTVSQLMDVVTGLTDQDSGLFFNWDGQVLPW